MKTLIMILTLSLVAVGCGSKRTNTSSAVGRNTVDERQRKETAEAVGAQWGSMAATYNQSLYNTTDIQKQFQVAVAGLMQSTLAPQYIGEVSGNPADVLLKNPSTGIRFYGRVNMEGNTPTTKNAILRISIFDSFTNKTDEKGNIIPEYPLYFTSLRTPVIENNGQKIRLTFENDYTIVTLEGVRSGAYFVGQVAYENKVNYDGGAVWKSKPYMGQFNVSFCGFFQGAQGCAK